MNALGLTSWQVVAAVGVLLALLWVWRAGARRGKAKARGDVGSVSLAGRVVLNAALIVGAQWALITCRVNGWLLLVVLAGPALFASYALTRALTVTTYAPRRRGERR